MSDLLASLNQPENLCTKPAGNVQLSPWPTLLFGEESITLQKTICNSGNLGETVATSFSTMIQHFLSSKSVLNHTLALVSLIQTPYYK